MTQSSNPLKQFFRQPALYVKLPSGGQYWPKGSLEMPPNQELPVLPMTAIDEITYRTPDALFNGSAVVSVIESCIPAVKDAWGAPSIDISAMLMAIRIASFGSEMTVESTCPACKKSEEYVSDLHGLMANIRTPDFAETIKHGDLEIFFRPVSYKEISALNTRQFDQQRVVTMLPDADMPEAEKIKLLDKAMQEIAELTLQAIKFSINGIRTPAAFVTEPGFIDEFLKNCDRKLFNEIKDAAVHLRESSENEPMKITCTNCQHEYSQTVVLDASNFFDLAS